MPDSLPVLGFATPKGTSMSAFLQPRCTLQPDEPKKGRGAAHFSRRSGIECRSPSARRSVMNEAERPIMSILGEAAEYASPEARAAFLERACAGDAGRRARVEELLRAHQAAGNFLRGRPPPPGSMATTDEPAASERPGARICTYKLLEQIGEGGFGVVFLAEQTQPVRRKVALKVLKPGMDTRQVVARFEAERQALAIMDHPNIAKVHDGGATPSGR